MRSSPGPPRRTPTPTTCGSYASCGATSRRRCASRPAWPQRSAAPRRSARPPGRRRARRRTSRRFRDALERHVELRHRYVDCFTGFEHRYDVLLDDFEPGMTTAVLRPLFAELCAGLVPLVADAAVGRARPDGGAFGGPHEVEHQRRAVMAILEGVGFDPDGWRLDVAPHPFAQRHRRRRRPHHDALRHARLQRRATTPACTSSATASTRPASPAGWRAARSARPVSLGVHESQSRLWENMVGRSRPFCAWALPAARGAPARPAGRHDRGRVYRGVNAVHRSLIRVEADETTYNLHIVLRFELELALIEGTLRRRRPAARVERGHAPAARRRRARRRPGRAAGRALGRRADRLLPDLHARQPDGRAALGGAARGPARRSTRRSSAATSRRCATGCASTSTPTGASCPPPELLARVTGQELAVAPFLRYLRGQARGRRRAQSSASSKNADHAPLVLLRAAPRGRRRARTPGSPRASPSRRPPARSRG